MLQHSILLYYSAVSIHVPTDTCAVINQTTTAFVSLVLIWSLVMNYLPSLISDWHSTVVSGLFVVYSLITVQSVIAVVCVLLLSYQVWCRLGDSHSYQYHHETFSKDL